MKRLLVSLIAFMLHIISLVSCLATIAFLLLGIYFSISEVAIKPILMGLLQAASSFLCAVACMLIHHSIKDE